MRRMSLDAIGTICHEITSRRPAAAAVQTGRVATAGFINAKSQLDATKAAVEITAVYCPSDRPRSNEYGTMMMKYKTTSASLPNDITTVLTRNTSSVANAYRCHGRWVSARVVKRVRR